MSAGAGLPPGRGLSYKESLGGQYAGFAECSMRYAGVVQLLRLLGNAIERERVDGKRVA